MRNCWFVTHVWLPQCDVKMVFQNKVEFSFVRQPLHLCFHLFYVSFLFFCEAADSPSAFRRSSRMAGTLYCKTKLEFSHIKSLAYLDILSVFNDHWPGTYEPANDSCTFQLISRMEGKISS